MLEIGAGWPGSQSELYLRNCTVTYNGANSADAYIQGGAAPTTYKFVVRLSDCNLYQVYTPRVFHSLTTVGHIKAFMANCSFLDVNNGGAPATAMVDVPAGSTAVLEQCSMHSDLAQVFLSAGSAFVAATAVAGTTSSRFN
jgi:hypothetical protein